MKQKLGIIASVLLVMFGGIPNSMGQWIKTNGPSSGGILSLAVNGKYLFAGTFFGAGISRTSDSGTTWTVANNGLSGSIGSTVVHSIFVSGAKMFAGTGDGMYSSTNNGSNWKLVSTGLPSSTQVTSFALSGSNLFAGTSVGVLLSTNNGISWNAVNIGLTNVSVECLAVIGSNLFAGTDGGVFLSTDNGINWTAVKNGLTDTTTRALVVIGNTLFVGTYAWPDTGSVFRSTDNGANWTKVSNGLQPAEIKCLAVSGTNLFAGIDSGVYLTTNNGVTWKSVSTGLTGLAGGYAIAALAIGSNYLFAGTDTVWRRPLSEFGGSSVSQIARLATTVTSFPNPFSKVSRITFSLTVHSFSQVTILNLLGSEVARLFTGELDAGEHSFIWDAHGLSPGLYNCIIEIGKEVRRIPMLLIK